jgi:hypothetical protein
MVLDNRFGRSTIKYHLRSVSGSSGPIAKETSPLLGWRPILVLGQPLHAAVVSIDRMMKRIRYAVWLPLIHLAIMAPLISLEEAKGWKYLPVQQRIEDYDKAHPQKPKLRTDAEPQVEWDPYYEYCPSLTVTSIYTVEFPAAFLFRWCGHPPAAFFMSPSKETWCRLFGFLRVRTRLVILDLLLLLGIYLQWWLVGLRLDALLSQGKRIALIKTLALVITLAGSLAALLSHGPAILDLIAVFACFLALLGWMVLIMEAATSFGRMSFQCFRGESA